MAVPAVAVVRDMVVRILFLPRVECLSGCLREMLEDVAFQDRQVISGNGEVEAEAQELPDRTPGIRRHRMVQVSVAMAVTVIFQARTFATRAEVRAVRKAVVGRRCRVTAAVAKEELPIRQQKLPRLRQEKMGLVVVAAAAGR